MKVFDDSFSYIHPVVGYAAKSSPLLLIGFIAYQLFEKEPIASKLGDFVEFGLGYVAASLVQK